MKKTLSILGSTGSIGTNTLEIVAQHNDSFSIKALSAYTNIEKLAFQIERFKPALVVVKDEHHIQKLKNTLPQHLNNIKILHGQNGYLEAATLKGVDMIVGAMVGAAGLLPTLAAIDAGKDVALANKETLVMAGELVMAAVVDKGVNLLPVDSEHSAIFQCLQGNRRTDLKKILLTASGGPFRQLSAKEFKKITPADALKHPNWSMGSKITIDSATLMNKGLEVIEARWLFDVSVQDIEVIVHPQSIVHSMVAYRDGSVMAQMGIPDMKGAISYALNYPFRLALDQPIPDFNAINALSFEAPDLERFPCLKLAFEACATGGTQPTVLNAANEVAVEAFLSNRICFTAIPQVVRYIMNIHEPKPSPNLDTILMADQWARKQTQNWISSQIGDKDTDSLINYV
ncbi:MAG: 1-deoxy-D-xylulose-5-phosphate reductoisomerase [Desulfobacteraceae bacterium]|jgi:1-deoxy-D-xylulose-5-phosphate reductoisomerase